MHIRTDIYGTREPLKPWLIWSAGVHGALVLVIALFGLIQNRHGENWGDSQTGSGAISATLVSAAAIPLPRREIQTENILANESQGLSQSTPKAREKPEPDAIAIPDKTVKLKPTLKQPSVQPAKTANVDANTIPYGQGGPVNSQYAMVNLGGSQGGIQIGGGDFGQRYSWYVDNVRRKVSDNWHKYEIDPNINNARRVYLDFDILRNGAPANVQVAQSSGIPSLDTSAVRALQRIDTFGPLPPGFNGSKVAVEFWFEYKK